MPKEVIPSNTPPFYRTDDGGEHSVKSAAPLPEGTSTALYQRAIHVGWNRRQYVEVGVAVITPSTGELQHGEGHFTDLDREGCNRLIEAVRKARNAAFGRDA